MESKSSFNVRVLILFALGLLCALVTVMDASALVWSVGVVIAALICYLMGGSSRLFRTVVRVAVVSYCLILFIGTIVAGLRIVSPPTFYSEDFTRVKLFFPDSNVLGAAIVVSVVSSSLLLFQKRTISFFALLLGCLPLVFTGSRTALIAQVVALVVYLMCATRVKRLWIMLTGLGLLGLILLVIVIYQPVNNLSENRNLLHASNDFSHGYWRIYGESKLKVEPKVLKAPVEGDKADYLSAVSIDRESLVVYQNVATSAAGLPYIGSIFLRADTPQTVVLSTQLSQIECNVTLEWQRCITPIGFGDGKATVQLRLETRASPGSFEVYAWGAQLEQAENVSTLQVQNLPSIASRTVERLGLGPQSTSSSQQLSLDLRLTLFREAFTLFLKHPITGVGFGKFSASLKERNILVGEFGHAHNLMLNMMAEMGVLGLLSWAIPFFGVLALSWGRCWRTLLPLVVATLFLNLFDITFYSNGVYYVYWLSIGLLVNKCCYDVSSTMEGHSDKAT
jgi:O-Antigen ligase